MQSVSSRIWTRDAGSISFDDNHYTTGHFQKQIKTLLDAEETYVSPSLQPVTVIRFRIFP